MTLSTEKSTKQTLFSVYANKSTDALKEDLSEKSEALKEQKELLYGNKSSSQVELLINDVSKLKAHIQTINEIIDKRKHDSA